MKASSEEDLTEEVSALQQLPWTVELRPDPGGTWAARVVELPGCMTEGESPAAALQSLDEAKAAWLRAALARGQAIPTPNVDQEYSGKIFVRTSPQLHRLVAQHAARLGVSMSQWVSEILARAVGSQSGPYSWMQLQPDVEPSEVFPKVFRRDVGASPKGHDPALVELFQFQQVDPESLEELPAAAKAHPGRFLTLDQATMISAVSEAVKQTLESLGDAGESGAQ